MNRSEGNLRESADLLNRASQVAPNNFARRSIQHSIAELHLRKAESARTPLERNRLLSDAAKIAQSIKSNKGDAYGYHTSAKVNLCKLGDLLNLPEDESEQKRIEEVIKDIERDLSEGLQQFPGDSHLLEAESKLASLLLDSERSLRALEQSFASNPRSASVALRLARYYESQNNYERAKITLESALKANENERKIHHAYAKMLMRDTNTSSDTLIHHLTRAFTPGDTHYDAQLLYARQLFIKGERDASKREFKRLGDSRVAPEFKNRLLYPIEQKFRGAVERIEAYYCFIARDGINDWIYANKNDIDKDVWDLLVSGTRVSFNIAFNLKGPGAQRVELENREYTYD